MSRFILEGLTPPYRPDIMEHGGGLMLFVRVEIPSKLLPNVNLCGKIENIFVKINLRLAKKGLFQAPITPMLILFKITHSISLRTLVFIYPNMKTASWVIQY